MESGDTLPTSISAVWFRGRGAGGSAGLGRRGEGGVGAGAGLNETRMWEEGCDHLASVAQSLDGWGIAATIQEVAQEVSPIDGEDRFGMELHALDG